MSVERREYRARCAVQGADTVEGNVDFTLDLGVLHRVPAGNGQTVYPLEGRSDRRPFTIEAVDLAADQLTEQLSENGRWAIIMRLWDVGYRAIDAAGSPLSDWTTYATGRCSNLSEPDGPGKYSIEISDESLKARTGNPFQFANTTQIWPGGIRYPWRGMEAAIQADGFIPDLVVSYSDRFFIRLLAVGYDGFDGSTENTGVRITDRMREWIRTDLKAEEDRQSFDEELTAGNFRHLRLSYDGTDYEIVTFSASGEGPILESLDEPEVVDGGQGSWAVRIWCWCFLPEDAPAPPTSSADAFLYAPEAPPSPDLPLHAGVDDPYHEWGNPGGYIHLADFTRRVWISAGVVYSEENLTLLEADKSFPALSPRITDQFPGVTPTEPAQLDDIEQWMQRRIWGPNMVAAGRDLEGKRILIDLRPPREIPLDTPILTANNAKNVRWSLIGREQINSVRWWFQTLFRPAPAPAAGGFGTLLQQAVNNQVPRPALRSKEAPDGDDPSLDNLYVSEEYTEPEDSNTVADAGRRLHTVDARAAGYLGYTDFGPGGGINAAFSKIFAALQLVAANRGALVYPTVKDFLTPALLATYQDGLIRVRGEIHGELGDTVQEGDLLWLDNASLKLPDPGPGTALGPEVGVQDPGGSSITLEAPPALGTPVLQANLSILVPVDSIPSGMTARLEYAATGDPLVPPSEGSFLWTSAGSTGSPANITITPQPRGHFVWIRVSGEADGRRQTTYSTPVMVEVPDYARILRALVTLVGGTAFITWRPGSLTEGVIVCYAVHAQGVAPDSGDFTCVHVIASETALVLSDLLAVDQQISVTIEAWDGWLSDYSIVDGYPGELVPVSAVRRRTLQDDLDTGGAGTHALFQHSDSAALEYAEPGDIPQRTSGGEWVPVAPGASSAHEIGDHTNYTTGTSFPGSPTTSPPTFCYRTDRNIEYFWDGTRWLSTHIHTLPVTNSNEFANFPATGTVTAARTSMPWVGVYAFYVEDAAINYSLTGAGNWTLAISSVDTGLAATTVATTTVSAAGTFQYRAAGVNLVLPNDEMYLVLVITENSGTASINWCLGVVAGRLVG